MIASSRIPRFFGRRGGSSPLSRRPAASQRSPVRRMRPDLVLLEDRTMLSAAITINSLLDQVDPAGSAIVTLRDRAGER
jgi:hypothetical protein